MSRVLVVALVLGALLFAASASAEALPTGLTRSDPIPSPGAFYVHGSNGYLVSVFARRFADLRRDEILVAAVGRRGSVVYQVPANLAGEGIHASLGPFGRIDVAWKPNGRIGEFTRKCHGYRTHIYLAEGAYVGDIEFKGERDFTEANVSSVKGRTGWFRLRCGGEISEGFPGPGVLLEAFRFSTDEAKGAYRELSVVQNRPHGMVSYGAAMGGTQHGIPIAWAAYAEGPARTLSFDSRLETALLSPPAPFSGSATFERVARHRPGKWRGDLTVNFPGRPAVPLAGKEFGATFMHGYRESFPRSPHRASGGESRVYGDLLSVCEKKPPLPTLLWRGPRSGNMGPCLLGSSLR